MDAITVTDITRHATKYYGLGARHWGRARDRICAGCRCCDGGGSDRICAGANSHVSHASCGPAISGYGSDGDDFDGAIMSDALSTAT